MAVNLERLEVFRIVPLSNLKYILTNGLFCKNECPKNEDFKAIGSEEIISRRSRAIVKCYPDTVVNDYVPFYFSVRTPMLLNINTGWNVPYYPQSKIIYLCFRLKTLAVRQFQWCYTDGNAAVEIAKFYTDLGNIELNVDWSAIKTTDFSGRDVIRKKHAEFLVKKYVPPELIGRIVVYDNDRRNEVEAILNENGFVIPVEVNTKYYF